MADIYRTAIWDFFLRIKTFEFHNKIYAFHFLLWVTFSSDLIKYMFLIFSQHYRLLDIKEPQPMMTKEFRWLNNLFTIGYLVWDSITRPLGVQPSFI